MIDFFPELQIIHVIICNDLYEFSIDCFDYLHYLCFVQTYIYIFFKMVCILWGLFELFLSGNSSAGKILSGNSSASLRQFFCRFSQAILLNLSGNSSAGKILRAYDYFINEVVKYGQIIWIHVWNEGKAMTSYRYALYMNEYTSCNMQIWIHEKDFEVNLQYEFITENPENLEDFKDG